MRSPGARRAALVFALIQVGALGAGCAVQRPPLDDVLAPNASSAPSSVDTADEQALERAARAARDRARSAPSDAAAQLAAARALFRAADVRVQRAIAASNEVLLAAPDTTGEALLAAEDRAVTELGGTLLALTDAVRQHARRALALEPADAELCAAALHLRALGLALGAQAMGPRRALFEGQGRKVVDALDATLAAAPEHERGAPRLLHGRFRDRAPWPYQDRELAVRELELAAELDPTPTRFLFLGDALFGLGDAYSRAVEAWQRAAHATADPAREPLAEFYRRRARARLALVDDGRI